MAGGRRGQEGRDRAHPPTVLSIAGSDSGGGAGIQADLKAFARCGVHGVTAITAITAQNTVAVDAIHPLPSEIVLAQARTVLADIAVDAVKVGMLATAELADAVATLLAELPGGTPVVVDPVMVAESGARLLDSQAELALVRELLPRATVVTPNLPEARVLASHGAGAASGGAGDAAGRGEAGDERGTGDDEDGEARRLARAVLALGPGAVVLTGGHRPHAVDLFVKSRTDREDVEVLEIAGERHRDGAAHGSGCTHSSLIAAQLALGRSPLQAARVARELTGEAIAGALRDLGAGAGPVDVIGLAGMRVDD
ncbi:MAG TPA: bifunctional hydroxymethylpyrimidine kinase/phosphomethylpyrimidine kinase [Solirubrobacteraceae bacterium]|nr:bifunctional hydroxymethylpyrimidine kinase/phosphomethylpyrimidine kinase [Solirubrobacteraceae bacterium]